MKLANESAAGFWTPWPPGLDGLIARLEVLSLSPMLHAQRDLAMSQALRPYFEAGGRAPLPPFAQEVELATLMVYADYYPQDGQLTLIEQLRDVVTEHIPEEERAWLDPLKHSYMDLGEVCSSESPQKMPCRSLGDHHAYQVDGGDFSKSLQGYRIVAHYQQQGTEQQMVIDQELIDTSEFQDLGRAYKDITPWGGGPWGLEVDSQKQLITDLSALTQAILNLGGKGLSIQRYKGLGEMNA